MADTVATTWTIRKHKKNAAAGIVKTTEEACKLSLSAVS